MTYIRMQTTLKSKIGRQGEKQGAIPLPRSHGGRYGAVARLFLGVLGVKTWVQSKMAIWYDVPMSVTWERVLMCDECGHRWLAEGEAMPERCPSRKCRSARWNKNGAAEPATKPREMARQVADSIPSVTIASTLPPSTAYQRPKHADNCRCGICSASK